MADFTEANKHLSKDQLAFIRDINNYKIGESVIGFTARKIDDIINSYEKNAIFVREFRNYHDATQIMHEAQLILKSNKGCDMSQFGITCILKKVVSLQIATEINQCISDVTVVRSFNDENQQFVRYAKIIFVVKKEECFKLNNTINLIKKHIITSVKLVNLLGGNGRDSVCHFTTNKNAAYLYKYRIYGLRPNFYSSSIKELASLQQLAIFFAINMKQLEPMQWEYFVSYDAIGRKFKENVFELSTNKRIENLDENIRIFEPTEYTINGLPCGLNIRISRIGKLFRATNKELLINNEKQKSEFQQKIDSLCTHQPVIDEIHKQAIKLKRYQISTPLLVQAMSRIFNYKDNQNGNISPYDTIKYAVDKKLWIRNDANIKFKCCMKQSMQQINNNDLDDTDMVDLQNNSDNLDNLNIQCNSFNSLNFGGSHNSVSHRNA